MKKRDHTLGLSSLLIPLAALLLGAAGAWACEFIVLAARRGHSLSDLRHQAAPFQDFLAQQAAPPNNDGYGLVWYGPQAVLPESQRHYATGLGTVWYRHNDGAVLDSAFARLWQPSGQARLVLGHVRNGTGGQGSHPFVQHRPGRSYSFQHNGDLTNGSSHDMKEALLDGLNQSGFFQRKDFPGSNWLGTPDDVDSWIDSELLFLYLLHHVDAAGGDLVRGLHAALNEEDWFGFDVKANLTSGDRTRNPPSVINFALSDGGTVVVYKNARDGDAAHELAWRDYGTGLVGVKTEQADGFIPLKQHELLVLPPDQPLFRVANMHDALPEPDPARPSRPTLLSASPNPFNPHTTLRFKVAEAGPVTLAVHNLRGERVALLAQGEWGAGEHAFTWRGLNDSGAPAASGTYLVVLDSGAGREVLKLLLVR